MQRGDIAVTGEIKEGDEDAVSVAQYLQSVTRQLTCRILPVDRYVPTGRCRRIGKQLVGDGCDHRVLFDGGLFAAAGGPDSCRGVCAEAIQVACGNHHYDAEQSDVEDHENRLDEGVVVHHPPSGDNEARKERRTEDSNGEKPAADLAARPPTCELRHDSRARVGDQRRDAESGDAQRGV